MNHNERAVEITVELLKKHGIHNIVISPGGTNIPLVRSVQNDPFFTCYSVVDERSAIYFAIGLYLQTGEIIATSCTSAQATRNYIPGLTEAFYKRVPILAITMEKHSRFIGQEYMQAPHQASLPDDCVKNSYELPFINDINGEYHCIRLVNEAILSTTSDSYGPVQLCVPWLDFDIGSTSPSVRKIEILDSFNDDIGNKKVMIVIGEHRPFKDEEAQIIDRFAERHNCAVYANHLSNFHGNYSVNANLGFTYMPIDVFVKEYAPEIIISIGGQTGDYPLYLLLSRPEFNAEHWRVSEDGQIIDTYDKLTRVYKMRPSDFFDSRETTGESDHTYFEKLNSLCKKANTGADLPLSNAYLAQSLHDEIPSGSIIQFSILNSLRVWNLFPLDPSIECYSNVGAFGIDGGLSTLIGQSVVTDKKAYMIIGDLAFYYDMNSIGIRHIKSNLKIIVVNNNGGVEFKLYNADHSQTNSFIAAADHFKTAKGWAESCGFQYVEVRTKDDFETGKKLLTEDTDRPVLMEVFVSDKDDFTGYKQITDANRDYSLSYIFKKGINKLISH